MLTPMRKNVKHHFTGMQEGKNFIKSTKSLSYLFICIQIFPVFIKIMPLNFFYCDFYIIAKISTCNKTKIRLFPSAVTDCMTSSECHH